RFAMQMRVQLVIGLFCTLLGAVVLYVVPITRFDCARQTAERVDCRITKRALGFIPIRSELVQHVVSAEYSSQTRRSDTPVRGNDPNSRATTTYFHVRLTTAVGGQIDAGETAFVVGDSSENVASGINAM